MTIYETFQKHWLLVAAGVTFLAALLTVIVRSETVYHWIVPRQTHGVQGAITYDYQDTLFYWPQSLNPKSEEFFKNASSFVKLNIQNQSQVEVADVKVILTGDAILEEILSIVVDCRAELGGGLVEG